MKTYNQFLNETANFYSNDLKIEDYIFNIDMRFINSKEIHNIKNAIINELEIHTSENDIRDITINRWCYAWRIDIRNFSNHHTFIEIIPIIEYTLSLTYDITPEEFLKVGLLNVKEYLESKKNANKYNL